MDNLPMNKPDPDVSTREQGGGTTARLWCFASLTLQGIRSNPFQLVLTVLTMSVGTMALALTFFVGRGAIARVWSDVEQIMGQWVVAHADAGLDPRWMKGRPRPDFTESELQELRRRLPAAKFVCPIYMGEQTVVNRTGQIVLPVDGVTVEVGREPLFRALRGSGFSASAQAGMAWECMVTERAAQELALKLEERPTLLVGGQPYRVVGVVPSPPREDRRYQARVVVPYASAQILWMPAGAIRHVIVGCNGIQDMAGISASLRQALDEVRGPNTYFLSSSQFSIEQSKSLVMDFMMIGAVQSFFCILVASIGVLNVMLTSVTRRAHEFAVRLTMGATRREILGAVVVESLMISTFGALLGVALALVVAPHLTDLLAAWIPQAGLLSPLYCFEGFFYPFLLCGLCGLAASVYPALRASRVDVLASLRADA